MLLNMSVTIKTFFDEFNSLVQELEFDRDDNMVNVVKSILDSNLVNQFSNEMVPCENKLLLLEDTVIENKTLSNTLSVFDDIVSIWKFRANFQALLDNEEESNLFIELLVIYDNFWLEKTRDYIKKEWLLSSSIISNHLYNLVNRVEKWEDVNIVIQNELEKKWIDINENPIDEVYKHVQLFIDRFRFMVTWLINNCGQIDTSIN